MDLKEFELMTKEEKIDFLVKERIEQLTAIETQKAAVEAQQAKAQALVDFEKATEVQLETVRVARYKEKLALAESFQPKAIIKEEPIEDVKL